ncbi:MAG: hypothetical protein ABIH87_00910 [bacterium]
MSAGASTAEKNQSIQEVEPTEIRSEKMNMNVDVAGHVNVELNISSRSIVEADFASRSDIETLLLCSFKKVEKHEENQALNISGADILKDSDRRQTVIQRGEQASKLIEQIKRSVDYQKSNIYSFLMGLVGGKSLLSGNENKGLLKIKKEAISTIGIKTGQRTHEGVNKVGDNKVDVPVGENIYALSPANAEKLKVLVKGAPEKLACELDPEAQGQGWFTVKFGEVPVVFVESGNVEYIEGKKEEKEKQEPEIDTRKK